MNITVIGSGYVGTTAAAIFALSGHDVTAIDIDESKINLINSGKAPFFEVGLDELIAEGIKRGTLRATNDYSSAVPTADIVFSCVGTPDNPDGSSNLSYVYDAAKKAAEYLKADAIYVQKSTVPVGTGRDVTKVLPSTVPYVSNPEFLREGTAIYDTIMFDRVLAGGNDDQANQKVLDLHRTVEQNSADLAKVASLQIADESLASHSGEYITTNLESAELIKVTANAFLSLKISFANSVAKLCDATGANVSEVMSVVGMDNRIGKAFFNAGRGYGGGCFPKDVSGLISSAIKHGVDMPIMTASTEVNESMPSYIIEKVVEKYGKMEGKSIAVLGLAFKAGTSDTRKSPAIKIANTLVKYGAMVTAYDPEAIEEAKPDLHESVQVVESASEAVKQADFVFVATDWQEFKTPADWLSADTTPTCVIDCMNCLDSATIKEKNIDYIAVGK